MTTTMRDAIRAEALSHRAARRLARYALTALGDKAALRRLIAESTAGVPVRRVEPATADGALTWIPSDRWLG
jgi:hypothetical protein